MKPYIPSLNGLRAISILIVLLSHESRYSRNFPLHFSFPFNLFADGFQGVNMFFVISGFLITMLLVRENRSSGTISLKSFYLRRIFRIFPAYYFLLIVYFALQLCSVLWLSKLSWFTSLFYLKDFGGGDVETGHFWSLSVEEQFYLFWPIIIRQLSKRLVLWIAVFIIALSMVSRVAYYYDFGRESVFASSTGFFLRVDALMIGALTALYFEKIVSFLNKYRYIVYLIPAIFLLLAFLNTNFLTDLNMSLHLHIGFILIPLGIGWSNGPISHVLLALTMVISIISVGSGWYQFLNSAVMNQIGIMSYSIYLWQQIFFSENVARYVSFPINLIPIMVMAFFSYRVIERPFLKIKAKFSSVEQKQTRHYSFGETVNPV